MHTSFNQNTNPKLANISLQMMKIGEHTYAGLSINTKKKIKLYSHGYNKNVHCNVARNK